jgi:iron complex outermembrane receptor protein
MFPPIRWPSRTSGTKIALWGWGLALLVACSIDRVSAQSLDYGKYENLFGESVTMSATGKPERVSDSPVLMDLISAQDIQRSGARDIPTLLNRLAGINLTHDSTDTIELGIGGYQQTIGSRVMVLINGRQVYFDGFGDVFWSAIPVELQEIRQIEVIHGTQSALYGFNAVDGVINIVTFDPVDDPVNSATARIGNHARRDLSATVTQALGSDAGVRISAATDHAHDYGLTYSIPGGDDFMKDPNRRSASFDAGIVLPDGARLNLEGSHSDITERAIVYDVLYNARITTDSLKAGYTADTGIGSINTTGYYSGFQAPWVQTLGANSFGVGDRSLVGQISDLFKVGSSDSFRLETEIRHDELNAGKLTAGILSADQEAGSLMWEHHFSPALSSVNAVRYDYFKLGRDGQPLPLNLYSNSDFDRSVQGTSVNTALIDKLSGSDTLRLSFARGLKLPSLADFGQVEQIPASFMSFYHFGNPNLVPTAVYDYQAGWDHQIADWGVTSRASIFHQMTMHHIGNPISFVDGAIVEGSSISAGSVANGITWGLQHKAKEGWTWGINYTFERLHKHADLVTFEAPPVHKINGNVGYAWESWEADLYGGYSSATEGTFINGATATPTIGSETIKGFSMLSPRLAWHANDLLTVELAADNLWSYRDSVSQRIDATYYLSLKFSY